MSPQRGADSVLSGVAPANQTKERGKTKSSWISPNFVNSGVLAERQSIAQKGVRSIDARNSKPWNGSNAAQTSVRAPGLSADECEHPFVWYFGAGWCFSLGKQARFTLNFCSGMPLRKVHELAFLGFGLPGPLLILASDCRAQFGRPSPKGPCHTKNTTE